MYARIVRASLTAQTAEEAVTYFENTILPSSSMPGLRLAIVSTRRQIIMC